MDSSEDDKFGDTTIVYNDGCDTDSDCDELSDDDPQQQNYTILKEEDILKLQEIDVTSVSTVLSISKAWASILLRNFQWSLSRVYDEWFADGDRVRRTLGLLFPENAAVVPPPNRLGVDVTCGICFEPYSRDVINSAACGHPYCKTCWEGYISTSINNDGPGCLTLRCPHPACGAAITKDMIDISAASDENKRRYSRYLLRSYVEDHTKNIKWCPAPGCDFAIVFETAVGKTRCHDITCLCSHSFCWNCMEEAHRPVDCATALEWNLKNSCESTNIEWILANAKPCPKCKRPIERYQDQVCIAMTCSNPCNYKFCWLCLDELSEHGWGAGSLYACKRYQIFGYEGEYEKAKKRRELAKNYMERYVQYYERWAANESSRKKALAYLRRMQTVHIEKPSNIQLQPKTCLASITDAWLQIVECRQVLKWTYAYGYYLPENDEHAKFKKEFFEYLQLKAESSLEKLHRRVEDELQEFIQSRVNLTALTIVTKTYFKNLVSALENGLSDV